ncbi:hypothetical protein [Actinomadura sp. HBU206391]|uniref:hypothetical protein n=1 Tax=Actinomadura sp. HBU206391 TaxID=2731692 RepID=UPI001C9C5E9F|nr:hypothetical protein [Actinomadura sp. HBU206391]
MTTPMDDARRIADAVLYEGYLLYPYRASAAKNRVRWQFGVLVPPGFTATGEPSASRTECLLEAGAGAALRLHLRFLHVRSRTVEVAAMEPAVEPAGSGGYRPVARLTVGGTTHFGYDEATPRETQAVLPLAGLLDTEHAIDVDIPGGLEAEPIISAPARIMREHLPLRAGLRLRAIRIDGPYGLVRLRVDVCNKAHWDEPEAPRELALRRSLIATHLLLGVTGGRFVSLLDPPEWARAAADGCVNEHIWPVLVGDPEARDTLLSSPIILYDHPAIAPESPGELFDGTEIDELLSLRTLTLTEAERREAMATDPRAAELVQRVADLPPELIERLHGAIRALGPVNRPGASSAARPSTGPPGHPGIDAGAPSEIDGVVVAGVPVGRGSRVLLRPGVRGADAQDMFLAGRAAVVEAVLVDVDGAEHLAVTLEDDPGADLQRAQGRFRYFAPDEIEPIAAGPGRSGTAGGDGHREGVTS